MTRPHELPPDPAEWAEEWADVPRTSVAVTVGDHDGRAAGGRADVEELDEADELPIAPDLAAAGAVEVLRRGLRISPELRAGLVATVAMALAGAVGRLAVPILIQLTFDHGIFAPGGFDRAYVMRACIVGAVLCGALYLVSRATYRRLVRAAEATLYGLRVRVFTHLHELAIADHNEARRGVLVARVTSDIETIARFVEWGAVAWLVNGAVIGGVLVVMTVYSWRLALLFTVVFLPTALILRSLQRRQLQAYDQVRTTVGDTLSGFSEALGGAGVIRAYGIEHRTRAQLRAAARTQYGAQVRANRYMAVMFSVGDVFGALSLALIAAVGVWFGPGWGMEPGELVAFLFLVSLVLAPVAELSEVLDQTQTAIAGWRKVLSALELPIEVAEPEAGHGRTLPPGALGVEVQGVGFAYRDGVPVLRGVDVAIPAGTSVAVVGETGSGKTTFAKLVCRLADPTTGRVRVGGVDLRDVAPTARRTAIRLVPQDGFLFATTVRENIRLGRPAATDVEVDGAVEALGLQRWVASLPAGLDTDAGERGTNLSVGERQLVALLRAQLSDPGLLLLDEATSSVDPETEQALATALDRLAAGRTTISVAHRLATAERADLILVFDEGRLVEQGDHDALVAAGGVYAGLHRAWLGNTTVG